MKKKYPILIMFLASIFLLAGCNSADGGKSSGGEPSQGGGGTVEEGKIKEIALKNNAKTTLSVTDRINTVALFELRPNKGQTLKTADKKVVITSSDPTILKVENTGSVVSTFLEALKPGTVKLNIQSQAQEDIKLDIDMTIKDSVFDRQAIDGFFGNSWDSCDFTHEVDEENPYIKTEAQDGINHQFYFRDSYTSKCYVESEFTFYSEEDGGAHLPKLGFVFSTNEVNETNLQSVSFIYFDTDCRNGNDTFYNIGYNEIANGVWGWDYGGQNALAKSCGLYRNEVGTKVGETFKMGVVKDGYNYHVYFNDQYVKSIETTKEGFSVDKTYQEAAPTICGLFDFKSEVKYSNYSFTTDSEIVASKIPATPDFVL